MSLLAVISDIHANARALEAVLAHKASTCPEADLACLGDVAGYGSSPAKTIHILRSVCEPDLVIGGNHDYGLLNLPGFELSRYNDLARRALENHLDQLEREDLDWLRQLPQVTQRGGILFTHGSPLGTNHYVFDADDIAAARKHPMAMGKRIILHGHTHLPSLSIADEGEIEIIRPFKGRQRQSVSIDYGELPCVYINPGSVGQPRDEDPRACYAVLDSSREKVTWYRVDYDQQAERGAIIAAGLPAALGDRLLHGY